MKRTKLRMLQFMAILFMAMLTSCNIWEDNSHCATPMPSPTYIKFKYDYNMAYQDLFPVQCDKVELFVFDANDNLIQRIEESGDALKNQNYKMPLELSAGDYTLMAWAGHKESYTLENAENGTSIHDILLHLNHTNHTSNKELEALWNGTILPLSIKETSGKTETINLVKNTNRFTIKLHSMSDDFDANDFIVEIKSANGSYHADNTSADNNKIIYQPFFAESVTPKESAYSLDCLRLVDGEETRLRIIDKKTGSSMLPTEDIDLIDFLLKTKPMGMGRQEYLDREDTWEFSLYTKQTFIAIMIQINGWTVWSQDDEL